MPPGHRAPCSYCGDLVNDGDDNILACPVDNCKWRAHAACAGVPDDAQVFFCQLTVTKRSKVRTLVVHKERPFLRSLLNKGVTQPPSKLRRILSYSETHKKFAFNQAAGKLDATEPPPKHFDFMKISVEARSVPPDAVTFKLVRDLLDATPDVQGKADFMEFLDKREKEHKQAAEGAQATAAKLKAVADASAEVAKARFMANFKATQDAKAAELKAIQEAEIAAAANEAQLKAIKDSRLAAEAAAAKSEDIGESEEDEDEENDESEEDEDEENDGNEGEATEANEGEDPARENAEADEEDGDKDELEKALAEWAKEGQPPPPAPRLILEEEEEEEYVSHATEDYEEDIYG